MPERLKPYLDLARQILRPDGHRFAVLEGNQGCNRDCSYCAVPAHYNPQTELTLAETCQTIDWLYGQGFRLLSYRGGETLAPFRTKEEMTYTEHTLGVVRHAKRKGMLVNVTSNGDYINPQRPTVMEDLAKAGLDSLTLSLHSYTDVGLRHLINTARLASRYRIVPAIQTVMTSQTADKLPAIAAQAAKNGVLFGVGVVQVQGDGFSKKQDLGVIPTKEQQERIFRALRILKAYGFVKDNRRYLTEAPKQYPNRWVCNSSRDAFIAIGAGGKVNVCSAVETGIRVRDIRSLHDTRWRERKKLEVANCRGCFFHCYFEAENTDFMGDIPTAVVGLVIKAGLSSFAERWGKIAVSKARVKMPDVDWGI